VQSVEKTRSYFFVPTVQEGGLAAGEKGDFRGRILVIKVGCCVSNWQCAWSRANAGLGNAACSRVQGLRPFPQLSCFADAYSCCWAEHTGWSPCPSNSQLPLTTSSASAARPLFQRTVLQVDFTVFGA